MSPEAARTLNDKGRCCGRKPILYKGGAWNSPPSPQKFCTRCSRAYNPDTGVQQENWAFIQVVGGFVPRPPIVPNTRSG